MIHLMIDPNMAAEFTCAQGKDGKRSKNELFPVEEIAARKPSLTYMADGRKLLNGHVETELSPNTLWQDTLIRGQLMHQVGEAKMSEHHPTDIIQPHMASELGSNEEDTADGKSSRRQDDKNNCAQNTTQPRGSSESQKRH